MTDVAGQHRQTAPRVIRCAVITVSDTRTPDTDESGRAIVGLLRAAGHEVASADIVPDELELIRARLAALSGDGAADAILITGGTGLAERDRTYETIAGMLTKALPGYGELFRSLSYQQIGAAAMLSRATGGLIGRTVVLSMPGSPAGVELAMHKLILPELAHLVREARR